MNQASRVKAKRMKMTATCQVFDACFCRRPFLKSYSIANLLAQFAISLLCYSASYTHRSLCKDQDQQTFRSNTTTSHTL